MNKVYGITFGAFDLLHPGHLLFLKQAKDRCDHLLVGLHSDPSIERPFKNSPVQTIYERYIQLTCCKYVDTVFPYDTEKDLENILNIEKVDIRFLGDEYINQEITGHDICKSKNIKLIYLPRKHKFSSTDLRERIHDSVVRSDEYRPAIYSSKSS